MSEVIEEMSLTDAHALLRRMDPKLTPDSDAWRPAVVLLLAVFNGTHDIYQLRRMTGYDPMSVSEWVLRLRDNGVFRGRAREPIFAIDWADEGSGDIAFWMDINVAMGFVERAATPTPEPGA